VRALRPWTSIALCLWFPHLAQAQDVIYRDGFEPPCNSEDLDLDRLTGCEEAQLATNPLNADTDADGLLDGDEVLGTVHGLDLPAMGVSPMRKDLLVEMDWTDDAYECAQHSHRPPAHVVENLRTFFASAPVSNPDGSTGINFIADLGQGGILTGGNYIAIPDGVVTGDYVHDYKSANFAPNRKGYFRYQLHAHRFMDADFLGIAGDDDSLVVMRCITYARDTQVVILHELGHNLGLGHGGGNGLDYKPNYNSVMNGKFFGGLDVDCDTFSDSAVDLIGFSDGSRNTLDPEAMDEAAGICKPDHPEHRPIDWNCNGVIDSGTVVDPVLRYYGGPVSDFDDYAALRLPPRTPQDRVGPALDDHVRAAGAVSPSPVVVPCFSLKREKSSPESGVTCPHPTPFR
jgi:hypothetical protein